MATSFAYGTFPRPLGTSMDPEEYAYPAGSLRQSRRFGRVLCSDGTVRRVKLGVADTFFTIPAVLKIKDKTVHGAVSSLPHSVQIHPSAPDNANEILAFFPYGVNRHCLPEWASFTWVTVGGK